MAQPANRLDLGTAIKRRSEIVETIRSKFGNRANRRNHAYFPSLQMRRRTL